jgi:hypothetical protein
MRGSCGRALAPETQSPESKPSTAKKGKKKKKKKSMLHPKPLLVSKRR